MTRRRGPVAETMLGDRQWVFHHDQQVGTRYVYVHDQGEHAGLLWVMGAFMLTPDQARDLAETLRQAADELDAG